MEELRNLNELAKQVVQNFNEKFDARDRKIPLAFKEKVKNLKSFTVVYNDYSVIIKGDGVRSKDSYVPNQSFYMASFFIEYSYELSKYKQKIMPWLYNAGITTNELTSFFTHERDKGKEDVGKGEDKFVNILDTIGYNQKDREFLINFVTNYDWWSGSKTIERSDFFNSPVLSIMGLTASSNAAMAMIVDHLTQHPECADLLLQQVENKTNLNMNIGNYQQIFFGAPGTGKSHKVNETTEQQPTENVFRTTFHPDSDYSTFVGCYKPSMTKKPVRNVAGDVVKKGDREETEEVITYKFVPQAFTRAYIRAWHTEEPVFLVIEEINRGNCAQIFGDLFQLLDRKDGVSEYPVDADTDLAAYIKEAMKDSQRGDIDEEVKNGEKLMLPSNLYIWATMNTSDQSLFPIDSAFKRRWEWKYIPIDTHKERWNIVVQGVNYSWSSFLEIVNERVLKATSSEDKQLGFYFCKADDKKISAEKFVSKVLFYLWNDVFKDYEEGESIFRDSAGVQLPFSKFYKMDGGVDEVMVAELFAALGVERTHDKELDSEAESSTNNDEEDDDGNTSFSTGKNYDKFSVNGEGKYGKNRLATEAVRKYIELHPELGAEEVLQNWRNIGVNVPHFIESKDEYESRTDNSTRSYAIPCGDTVIYVAHNGYGSNGRVYELISAVNAQNWGLTLAKVAE